MRVLASACWLVATACSAVPNPLYCDENTDCKLGKFCNLDTHGCELLPIDAAAIDEIEIDAPLAPRTIKEVRADTTPLDTSVDLQDVVVVAVDRYGPRVGDVWVQDEGGGPLSGIRIFGAVSADVATLSVGDKVDIAGARKLAFAPLDDTTGRKEVELAPVMNGILHLTKKTAAATPVVVTPVDLAAIAQLPAAQRETELDKLVGMLIRVTDATAVGAPSQVLFSIGVLNVDAELAAFPKTIIANQCFGSITGVAAYFRSYRLEPTTTADVDVVVCP